MCFPYPLSFPDSIRIHGHTWGRIEIIKVKAGDVAFSDRHAWQVWGSGPSLGLQKTEEKKKTNENSVVFCILWQEAAGITSVIGSIQGCYPFLLGSSLGFMFVQRDIDMAFIRPWLKTNWRVGPESAGRCSQVHRRLRQEVGKFKASGISWLIE